MRSLSIGKFILTWVLAILLALAGCKRGGQGIHGEPAYVSAPQANLRDRLSAIYNKVGVVQNGDRVEILEKSRRFVRVRGPHGEEGWMEARNLVGPEIADAFTKLEQENANSPVQGHGVARAALNMHATPGRETDHFYRLEEGAKVDVLKRATAEKETELPNPVAAATPTAATKETSGKAPALRATPLSPSTPKTGVPGTPLEDWWLVRDAQRHTGWVLARMIDLDVPLEIAQYAEGQRIMACFVLDQVPDTVNGQTRQVPQYLTLVNAPKDGTPWDYDQIRVFTWNAKRHRYETAYRERELFGVFPVTVGHAVFGKEGDLPTFTLRVKDDQGNITERQYKLNQPIVRRVLSPEEQQAEDARHAQRLAEILQARAARRAAHVGKPTGKRHQ